MPGDGQGLTEAARLRVRLANLAAEAARQAAVAANRDVIRRLEAARSEALAKQLEAESKAARG